MMVCTSGYVTLYMHYIIHTQDSIRDSIWHYGTLPSPEETHKSFISIYGNKRTRWPNRRPSEPSTIKPHLKNGTKTNSINKSTSRHLQHRRVTITNALPCATYEVGNTWTTTAEGGGNNKPPWKWLLNLCHVKGWSVKRYSLLPQGTQKVNYPRKNPTNYL